MDLALLQNTGIGIERKKERENKGNIE